MAIGEMNRNDNGTVTGWIAEVEYDFPHVFLVRFESDNDDDPDFRIMTKSPLGREVPLGFIWQRASQATGNIYFNGYIKTASSGYVPLRLLRSNDKPNVWNVVRRDSQQRRQGGPKEADLPPPPAAKRARKQAEPKQQPQQVAA